MDDIYVRLFFGHLVGDYLLQPMWMAIGKSRRGDRGMWISLLHSVIYTACVCLFLWTIDWTFVYLIFLSHYPIDRWSLAESWLKMIRGRDLRRSAEDGDPVSVSFAALVYSVVDNAMHLMIMWAAVRFVLVRS